jgi:hypothetical protein
MTAIDLNRKTQITRLATARRTDSDRARDQLLATRLASRIFRGSRVMGGSLLAFVWGVCGCVLGGRGWRLLGSVSRRAVL